MAELQDKKGILLETGTNEMEILELFINENVPGKDEPQPCHFGVNVAKVMQVIEDPKLDRPDAAVNPCFMGMISLRSLMIPVLDLSVWLGMDKTKSDYDVVIVTEFSNAVTGFLVSGVTNIHRVGWQEVAPPHDFIVKSGTGCIIGMVEMGDHFIQLLDLERILSDLDPQSLEEMAEPQVKADRQYTALVADDSPTIRLMLKKSLEAANFKVIMTGNGAEALDKVMALKAEAESKAASIKELVDVVISDIEMPRMDGFSLTKNIKNDPVAGTLPVILYSSIITKELRHKGESVGADEQVAKPDMNDMARQAMELIKRYEAKGA